MSIARNWYAPTRYYVSQAVALIRGDLPKYVRFLGIALAYNAVAFLLGYGAWELLEKNAADTTVMVLCSLGLALVGLWFIVMWTTLQRNIIRSVLLNVQLELNIFENMFSKWVWKYLLGMMWLMLKMLLPVFAVVGIISWISVVYLPGKHVVVQATISVLESVLFYLLASKQMLRLCFMHLQPDIKYSGDYNLDKQDQRLSFVFLVLLSQLTNLATQFMVNVDSINITWTMITPTAICIPLWFICYLGTAFRMRDILERGPQVAEKQELAPGAASA